MFGLGWCIRLSRFISWELMLLWMFFMICCCFVVMVCCLCLMCSVLKVCVSCVLCLVMCWVSVMLRILILVIDWLYWVMIMFVISSMNRNSVCCDRGLGEDCSVEVWIIRMLWRFVNRSMKLVKSRKWMVGRCWYVLLWMMMNSFVVLNRVRLISVVVYSFGMFKVKEVVGRSVMVVSV